MGQKKLVRKAESPSKSRIRWPRWTGFRGKTIWDWMDLLVVPLVLVVIGLAFTMLQDARQQGLENQRAQQAQKIENQRAAAERELADQRAQDEALQAYLDQMSNLLLEKDLRESKEDSEVRTLARARTLTVLGRLDPSHKTAVMQFLVEAELVQSPVEGGRPIIRLSGANLSGADLPYANLSGANLSDANLSDAHLHGANLGLANLSGANLSDANLSDADLAPLALLSDANLSGADLSSADLSSADLALVNLSGANLAFADLSDALLGLADLSSADLEAANLSRASLLDVEGISRTELEQQAESLEGAIMPDRTIHAGRYATGSGWHQFEPALSFSVSEGWRLTAETTAELSIESPEGGQLLFTRTLHVFDPSNLSEQKEIPAPENVAEWMSWFQSHPNLDTSKPVPVSVGGASGKQIDVTAPSTPENYRRDICGEQPCVPLYPTSTGGIISSLEGWKDRFIIVPVARETVLIDVAAPADKFDAFLPKAQKVLDTVE